VSGESILLVAEVDSVPYRAVGRLAEVTPRLPAFALIGGLAAWPQGVAATAPVGDTVRRLAGGGGEGAAWPFVARRCPGSYHRRTK
jgi:hypothetical protein